MPKTVPSTAAMSTVWPAQPSMRRPNRGESRVRMLSGMLRR
jgi:hypothetical protein